jgi:hypothetical protein
VIIPVIDSYPQLTVFNGNRLIFWSSIEKPNPRTGRRHGLSNTYIDGQAGNVGISTRRLRDE